jgi:hypothetical protein
MLTLRLMRFASVVCMLALPAVCDGAEVAAVRMSSSQDGGVVVCYMHFKCTSCEQVGELL